MLLLDARLSRVHGAVLFVPALLADCLVGLLFLGQGKWYLLLWHVPLALIWASGLNLMAQQDEHPDFTHVNMWGLSALLLGAGTFPGLGSAVYSLAFLVVRYLFALSPTQHMAVKEPELAVKDTFVELPPMSARMAQPLVDDIYEGDTEARRAVIAKISRAGQPNTTQLLRRLLFDAHADIRSDASIALTRLDDELSRALYLSFQAWSANPTDPSLSLLLVEQYYQYAISNVLDHKSQHAYLLLARDLLLQVISQATAHDAHLWLKLARMRRLLGELTEALHDARRALEIQPDLSEAALLAMELAFHTHAWDTLTALLASGASAIPPHTERPGDLSSFQWWAAVGQGGKHG